MNKKYAFRLPGACAFLYFLFDIPVRLTGFLTFESFVGIKCLLSVVCGLLFGPVGAAGTALGSLVGNLLMGTALKNTVFEGLSCLLMGTFLWAFWHFFEKSGRVELKKTGKLLLYLGGLALSAVLCAVLGLAFGGFGYFVQTAAAYISLGSIAGIPILILATSIVHIRPVTPRGQQPRSDLEMELKAIEELPELIDRLEEVGFSKGISMKRLFELENCIEESALRIWDAGLQGSVGVEVYLSDSTSLTLTYYGEKFNPLQKRRGEDADSMLGLLLLRARALRLAASYSKKQQKNVLHIVL